MSKRGSLLFTLVLAASFAARQSLAQDPSDDADPRMIVSKPRPSALGNNRPDQSDADDLTTVKRQAAVSKTTARNAGKTKYLKNGQQAPASGARNDASENGVSIPTKIRTKKTSLEDSDPGVSTPVGRRGRSPITDGDERSADDAGIVTESRQPPKSDRVYELTQYEVDSVGENVPSGGMTLEEQIAELRARIDNLSAPMKDVPPTDLAPIPAVAAPAEAIPSTVQGSVFADPKGATAAYGNDGLTFVSRNGDFKTHLGGMAQLDAIGFGGGLKDITVPGGAGTQPSVEFRRLRLRADGTMYNYIDWVFECDFALALQNTDQRDAASRATGLRSFPTGTGIQGGNTINVMQPTTIFLTFKEIPIFQNIRVGNQQDWLSLEHIESARFQDFMERSPVMDVFAGANNNGYAPGISSFGNTEDQMAGLQLGVYKNNVYDSGFTYSIGDAWSYGARGIWTPYYDEESKGRYMLHTGLGTQYRTFVTNVNGTTGFDNIRLRSRGDLRNAASTLDPNYADTGNFYAESQFLINPEIAFQWGSLLVQGEYMASNFYGTKPAKNVAANLGTVFTSGGYIETLYFLTGENRDYNRQQGVFGRVIPKENWDPCKGTWGAFQAGVRYDWLDLNKPGTAFQGGNAQDVTFGLNWFLNPAARFQLNYVLSWVNNSPAVTFPGTAGALNGARFTGDGTIQSFGGRMDFNF